MSQKMDPHIVNSHLAALVDRHLRPDEPLLSDGADDLVDSIVLIGITDGYDDSTSSVLKHALDRGLIPKLAGTGKFNELVEVLLDVVLQDGGYSEPLLGQIKNPLIKRANDVGIQWCLEATDSINGLFASFSEFSNISLYELLADIVERDGAAYFTPPVYCKAVVALAMFDDSATVKRAFQTGPSFKDLTKQALADSLIYDLARLNTPAALIALELSIAGTRETVSTLAHLDVLDKLTVKIMGLHTVTSCFALATLLEAGAAKHMSARTLDFMEGIFLVDSALTDEDRGSQNAPASRITRSEIADQRAFTLVAAIRATGTQLETEPLEQGSSASSVGIAPPGSDFLFPGMP